MTKANEVKAAVDDCVKRFGRIDILVNNVGGSAPGDAVAMSEEVWDRQIDHNLKTTFLGCKYVLPVMEKQGKGAIVNLASVAGLRMNPDRAHVAYSTTKLGILAFSKSTAISYARKGIRCNTVIPGLMHTALVEHRLAKTIAANDLQGLIDKRNAQCPTGKMGDAWDIAHAVLFLASDEARYITAAEIEPAPEAFVRSIRKSRVADGAAFPRTCSITRAARVRDPAIRTAVLSGPAAEEFR